MNSLCASCAYCCLSSSLSDSMYPFQVLAEAEKELSIRLQKAGQMKEEEDPVNESDVLPEWVEALRPVAKMATNVGSRIRIKVKEALELDPPDWAKELLEWSISKVVFKSNASGPTKVTIGVYRVWGLDFVLAQCEVLMLKFLLLHCMKSAPYTF